MIKIFISKIDGYFTECRLNVPIYNPITEFSYTLNKSSEKTEEFLKLLKEKLQYKQSTTEITNEDIPCKVYGFEYNVFKKEFTEYSDFKELSNKIQLENYKNNSKTISIDICVQENLL